MTPEAYVLQERELMEDMVRARQMSRFRSSASHSTSWSMTARGMAA